MNTRDNVAYDKVRRLCTFATVVYRSIVVVDARQTFDKRHETLCSEKDRILTLSKTIHTSFVRGKKELVCCRGAFSYLNRFYFFKSDSIPPNTVTMWVYLNFDSLEWIARVGHVEQCS